MPNFRLLRAIVLAAILGTPGFAVAQSVFAYSSAPGDYVGQGATRAFSTANATFQLFPGSGPDNLSLYVESNTGEFWRIGIAMPRGEKFAPGKSFNAERADFRTGRAAGIEVSGFSRGCNSIWGEVGIRQVSFNTDGNVATLEASFIQHCESADAPPLAGVIRYKATPLALTLDSDLGDYVGGGIHKTYHNDESVLSLSGTASYMQFAASGQRDDWRVPIAPPTGQTLRVGRYAIANIADATHARFDWGGNGRSCGATRGTLDIKRMTVGKSGEVQKLYAEFVQYCGSQGAALRGTIHYGT